jgi:hypothetical protein
MPKRSYGTELIEDAAARGQTYIKVIENEARETKMKIEKARQNNFAVGMDKNMQPVISS